MAKKKQVKTLKLFGTIFQVYPGSYAILGTDRYLYWASGVLKKQLDSYGLSLGDIVRIIALPSRELYCVFPEEVDDGGSLDTVEITENE